MVDLSVLFLHFSENINMFKRSLKSNHRVARKNKVDTHGTPVLHLNVAPVLVAEMCTTSHEHSMYIRFLGYRHMLTSFSKYKLVLYNVLERFVCSLALLILLVGWHTTAVSLPPLPLTYLSKKFIL